MKNLQTSSTNQSQSFIEPKHLEELEASEIDKDIAELNFRSFAAIDGGEDSPDIDEAFDMLTPNPKRGNGGLKGTFRGDLSKEPYDPSVVIAATLRSGGWWFSGHSGVCVKPNNPRKTKDGKIIKYESPREAGSQLFIPHVSVRLSKEIAKKFGIKSKSPSDAKPEDVNPHFWEYYSNQSAPLIITEGAKKACALISAGYPAIALNGVDGFGTNVYLKDADGEVLKEKNPHGEGDSNICTKDDDGNNIKSLIPALEGIIEGREVVLAFDVDDNPSTIKKVEGAKKRFRIAMDGIAKSVKQVKWKNHKGVDDLIAADGVEAFEKAYKKRLEVKMPSVPKPTKAEQLANSRFDSSIDSGLVQVLLDKEGKETFDNTGKSTSQRIFIGNHLQCIAYLNNPEGDGSALLLEFKSIRGSVINWTINRGQIVADTPAMLSELMNRGYKFDLQRKLELINYLNTLGTDIDKTYTIVDSTGWVNGRYISQHKTYGDGDYVFQQVETKSDAATEIKGTLDNWKTNVGAKCDNNSRLIFALGIAFAPALLAVTGLESGGFHLVGDTSTGKTTAVKVAVSVTGEKKIPTWRTTTNGLEMTATAHNHSMLPLDEIGQADEKNVGEACYMLRNGEGKSRSTKDLKARKVKTWQLLFLSTGEHTLASYMAQAGKVQKGGQEVGMPDIPAELVGSPYGVFESIHGCESSKEFAENLEAACKKYRGTAIDAFLTQLVANRQDEAFDGAISERVFKAAKKLAEGTTDLAVGRIANRFALVQVALELAHSYDILPFAFDRIEWAVKKMFAAWLNKRGGDVSIEITKACEKIQLLIAFNLHSDRMYDLKDRNVIQKVRSLLGYVKSDTEDSITEIWVPEAIFKSEYLHGAKQDPLIAELQKRGWMLPPGKDDRSTHQRQFKGKQSRYFIFLPTVFRDSEKTVGDLGDLGDGLETESSKHVGDKESHPTAKNVVGDVGDILRKNAVYSDFLSDPEVEETDPAILTEI